MGMGVDQAGDGGDAVSVDRLLRFLIQAVADGLNDTIFNVD
jgi:hypothetical protein